MNEFQSLLEDFLGISIHMTEWKEAENLPLYLSKGNEFQMAELSGICFLLAAPCSGTLRNVREARTLKRKLESISGVSVIFLLNQIDRVARDALIKARIEFAALPNQAYLPSLGILLTNKRNRKRAVVAPESFTVSDQMLYLFLQYNGTGQFTKSQAAEYLHMPTATMTRASEHLEALGLLSSQKEGREILIRASLQGYDYYQKAKPYLISPVLKSFFTAPDDLQGMFTSSGETLLSARRDLASPRYKTFAVYKKNLIWQKLMPLDTDWQDTNDRIKIEVWKYDPKLFAFSDGVDPVSLARTFDGIYDERLEDAVLQMLKENLR